MIVMKHFSIRSFAVAFASCLLVVSDSEAFHPPLRVGVKSHSSRTYCQRPSSVPALCAVKEWEGPQKKGKRFGWMKEKPKTSLEDDSENIHQSHNANQWMLNAVELVHWSTVIPAFISSFALFRHTEMWLSFLGQDHQLQVMLWCLAPFIGFVGGLPALVMHEYEDWQVAPFRDGEQVDIRDYNNQRLREVSYRFLLTIQSISFLMFYHGYAGFQMLPVSMALLGYAVLGDKNHLVSSYLPKKWTNEQPVYPAPVALMPFFVYSLVALSWTFWDLSGQLSGNVVKAILLLSTPVIASGGAFEGLVAESKFRQWDHLLAAFLFSIGMFMQGWAFWQIGQNGLL